MFPEDLSLMSSALIQRCIEQNIKIATAESCTGGLIASCLTSVPGSSVVFERGFNTYSNLAKNEMLGVPMDLINKYGAVSSIVAAEMCKGALKKAPVQLSIAVTGIAGPDGGTEKKPVGTVELASAYLANPVYSESRKFKGGRTAVRLSTVKVAIKMMLKQID